MVEPELVEVHVAASGRHQAALARPTSGSPPYPAVIVLHDIYGFSNDLKRHCQRFADAGYLALGPDLYRGRNPGCVVKTIRSMTSGKGFAYDVIAASRATLAQRDDVDVDRIGVAGFCMGGGFALLAAADQAFAVAAPFYGGVPQRASRLQGICPTIAQYGEQDVVFLPHAKRLARHLEELGVAHEVHIYEEAGHSFMNQLPAGTAPFSRRLPIRAFYEPNTEAKAWAKLLDFFGRHMPAPQDKGTAAPMPD